MAFSAPWWLRSAHLQTVWPTLFGHRDRHRYRRERIELDDGDFIDIDWAGDADASPLVLLFHGLEGSSYSTYIRALRDELIDSGCSVAAVNFRGCSGEPNRLARSYHSGASDDIQRVVDVLSPRTTGSICAVGFSLGGNALLKYLGEQGGAAPLNCAVAVSVPYLLDRAAERLEQGLSRFYRWWLIAHLHRSYRRKFSRRSDGPVTLRQLKRLRTFRQFDDCVTAPLHGYRGVDDYYLRASSRRYLADIRVPTLLLHADDDPFVPQDALPTATDYSSAVTLERHRYGGHVGFIDGGAPWRPDYWIPRRISKFLCR